MFYPSKMSSPPSQAESLVEKLGWADGMLMLVVRLIVSPSSMARTVTFEASPFPLSWSVQPVLNPCLSLSFPFGLLCLFSTLLCWHSTTAIVWKWEYYKSVTRGRCVSFSCALGSSVYPKDDRLSVHLDLPARFCLPMNKKKVLPRLCAALVKSIRAHHSEVPLPWAGSQLISTAIIKCWSLCDGQPPSHPWRGCWKHCVSGKPSSADGHILRANAYLAPVCVVMIHIALLL